MRTTKTDRLVPTQMELGECPVWDAKREKLFWVDIIGKKLHCYDWKGEAQTVLPLPALGGGLVLHREGYLMAGLQSGIHRVDPDSGDIAFITDPEPDKPNNRINEMKCDPEGRVWFGTMSALERVPTGALWRMDHGNTLKRLLDQIVVPNTLAWHPSGKHFLFSDSILKKIWKFRYDFETGDMSERSVFIDCGSYHGIPDGCAFDQEGSVWVAEFGGGCIRRYDPSGKAIDSVGVPATQVTTCGFAGPKLEKLVIITAKRLLSDDARRQQPEAGDVFVCEPKVAGAAPYLAG